MSSSNNQTTGNESPRILLTGACGQIGQELVKELRKRYGKQNVIATDVRKLEDIKEEDGPFYFADVLDAPRIEQLVKDNKINWFIHNTSILSASGEKNPELAYQVNINGFKNIIDIAKSYQLRLFAPSSIAAFGPSTPRDATPDITIQRPSTIYGVSKVFVELLGEYYHSKYGLDFRSLRYPGIISTAQPGGGTTDYAVEIFFELMKGKTKYECFLKEDSALPMMYMPDCIKATVDFLAASPDSLTQRTYNVTALSFTPKQLATEIQKIYPNFEVTYKPDFRQRIADSWPNSLDDSQARKDWGWKEDYNLEATTKDMIEQLKAKFRNQ